MGELHQEICEMLNEGYSPAEVSEVLNVPRDIVEHIATEIQAEANYEEEIENE